MMQMDEAALVTAAMVMAITTAKGQRLVTP